MNLTILRILLQIMADRSLVFLTLLLNFALFAFAVYAPDYIRFATAGLFSITVFIPVLKLKGGQNVQGTVREGSNQEAA